MISFSVVNWTHLHLLLTLDLGSVKTQEWVVILCLNNDIASESDTVGSIVTDSDMVRDW